MRLSSGVRRVSFLTLSVGVVVATVPMIYGRDDLTVSPLNVVQQQPVTKTENQQALSSQAQAPNGNPDATVFASIAEREVSQLHEGITLAKWMDARGKGERWEPAKPEMLAAEPQECLSLRRTEALPSGATSTRALYFYPPPVPSPVAFPISSGPALISTCILEMIRVEAQASTPEIGQAIAEAVRQQFSRQYGESIGMKSVAFWGPGHYTDAARWIHNAEIVSGYNAKPGLYDYAPGLLVRGPVAFVRARLPVVQELQHEACCTIKAYRYRLVEKAQFHRAIAMAGLDAVLSGRLVKLYEQVFQAGASPGQTQRPDNTKWRELLRPVLREWLSALKTVSPAQRAAGLLAADRLLEAAEDAGRIPGWPEKPEKRSELQELGAVFELNGIAGNYFYTRNLEKQVRELDLNGAAGQMAVIGSLARGSCEIAGWDSDLFRKVILDGENLLSKGLDASTAAQVHFMVGDAYSDIVAIAGGADPNSDYASDRLKGEADSARAKALQHYRAGLAVDNTSENAKDAWRQAWHLAAGLVPGTRYACFGD